MKIAVVLSDENFEKNLSLAKEKKADIIELRVDTFKDKSIKNVVEKLQKIKESSLESILTVRSEKEGGSFVENRKDIFLECSSLADYTDIELSSTEYIDFIREETKKHNKKLIISYHNFELTPASFVILEILREMERRGADILKLSFKANSKEDVSRLLCSSLKIDKPKVLISMGKIGKISRVASYFFGSVITYSYLDKSFAPGQIHIDELKELLNEFINA